MSNFKLNLMKKLSTLLLIVFCSFSLYSQSSIGEMKTGSLTVSLINDTNVEKPGISTQPIIIINCSYLLFPIQWNPPYYGEGIENNYILGEGKYTIKKTSNFCYKDANASGAFIRSYETFTITVRPNSSNFLEIPYTGAPIYNGAIINTNKSTEACE